MNSSQAAYINALLVDASYVESYVRYTLAAN